MDKTMELKQVQLDATFWEGHYCKQRGLVLQVQANQLGDELERMKKEKEEKEKIANEKTGDK